MKPRGLGRAVRYLARYRREAGLAYGAMLIATLAQLAVPQLIQNIIDTVTEGFIAKQVLDLPERFQAFAIDRLGVTANELVASRDGAVAALIWAGVLIIIFAAVRGLFNPDDRNAFDFVRHQRSADACHSPHLATCHGAFHDIRRHRQADV
jgi:ATP-binding cassette subfamily B protein